MRMHIFTRNNVWNQCRFQRSAQARFWWPLLKLNSGRARCTPKQKDLLAIYINWWSPSETTGYYSNTVTKSKLLVYMHPDSTQLAENLGDLRIRELRKFRALFCQILQALDPFFLDPTCTQRSLVCWTLERWQAGIGSLNQMHFTGSHLTCILRLIVIIISLTSIFFQDKSRVWTAASQQH